MGNSSSSSSASAQVIGPYYVQKKVLNEMTCASGTIDSAFFDAQSVSQYLKGFIMDLKCEHFSADGLHVDYKAIKVSEKYQQYVVACKRLTVLDLSTLSQSQLKAFCINIYNALVIHALIEGLLENETSTFSRMKFFATAAYNIGGQIYSLNDIENGLLRRNRLSAVPFTSLPFSQHDHRLQYMLTEGDPRIHFALNCGSASCPPIAEYSSDVAELEQQLQMATEGTNLVSDEVFVT
jgi:hypothetical protein